ncbi:baseplate J/gp47 family protein [Pseudomonas sp. BN515]|uniref:baseplate assembly protein n=1 Tax=Pseudomonas sp. BN515 TaxID=2567892 RepID=UPI002458D997|nr:baseplate J/gp47 family protein [Pseudomonas sp. BN515]MDH4869801.1 baseplate protein [Pseudomonas sp. BN515]
MRELPPPEFVKIDPAAIEADLVARYEAKSGKTLYPAQIERLFIDQVAYAQSLALMAIQHAGEQLLVRFSSGPILDYLGDLVGTPRLLAQPARCRLQFSVSEVAALPLLIPTGTQVTSQDGRLIFTTDADATIQAGQTQVQTSATCQTAGAAGNGWAAGQISVLPSAPFEGLVATNVTVPADGADEELDDRYRERIILAPEAYTNAGSRGSYRFHALSVHQDIVDVAVQGPDDGQLDGHVAVYPLTSSGLPTADMLTLVLNYLSGEKRRPLCDTVHALAPVQVVFTIQASLTFYATADRVGAMALAQAAADAWAANLRAGLGRDIVPEQLTAVLQVVGVYRAAVTLPVLTAVQSHQWANCTGIVLTDAGVVDG